MNSLIFKIEAVHSNYSEQLENLTDFLVDYIFSGSGYSTPKVSTVMDLIF